MEIKRVTAPGITYSPTVEVRGGRTLYISGQVPVDKDGKTIGAGDLETQLRAVFDQIRQLVMDAGGSLANVVKITAFLTTMDEYSTYSRVRGEYFREGYPASSAIKVAGLVSPEWLVEVEAVAVLPD